MSFTSDPAGYAEVVTPSDSTNLGVPCRGLWVGVAGNITGVLYPQGTAVLFSNVPVGIFPVRFSRINATGTTATNMVALS